MGRGGSRRNWRRRSAAATAGRRRRRSTARDNDSSEATKSLLTVSLSLLNFDFLLIFFISEGKKDFILVFYRIWFSFYNYVFFILFFLVSFYHSLGVRDLKK